MERDVEMKVETKVEQDEAHDISSNYLSIEEQLEAPTKEQELSTPRQEEQERQQVLELQSQVEANQKVTGTDVGKSQREIEIEISCEGRIEGEVEGPSELSVINDDLISSYDENIQCFPST